MHIVLIGISYRTAPVEVREQFAFNQHQLIEVGRQIFCESDTVSECVVVSTCNRSELYLIDTNPGSEWAVEFLCRSRGLDLKRFAAHFYTYQDMAAVDHLFRVAAGLDSMIIGEAQVLGQVKDAYQAALEAGHTGQVLNALFRAALSAGKRGRTETEIGRGAVSVSHAAVELAQKIYGNLQGRSALVLGAGEMSEITARLLVNAGVKSIIVSNRTYQRAQDLAQQIGGEAIRYDRFPEALQSTDIVISSTGAPHSIIQKDLIRKVMQQRRGRPIFLIDIAVPRDIDPDVGDLDNVFLYDIDDLQMVVERNVAEREKEIDKVLSILEEEETKFLHWTLSLEAVPTIADLQRRFEEIRAAEIERFQSSLSKLSETDRQTVELITRGLVKRILKEPMSHLKQAAQSGNGMAPVKIIRDLFGLDSCDENPPTGKTEKLS